MVAHSTYRERLRLATTSCIAWHVSDRLSEIRVLVNDSNSDSNPALSPYFYPADSISKIFTSEKPPASSHLNSSQSSISTKSTATVESRVPDKISVYSILRCTDECSQCTRFTKLGDAGMDHLVQSLLKDDTPRSSGMSIIASMCLIGAPYLIPIVWPLIFPSKCLAPMNPCDALKKVMMDNPSIDYLPAVRLDPVLPRKAPTLYQEKYERFADTYNEIKWLFDLREFPEGWENAIIDSQEILPIVGRKDVGQGGFGKVDSFYIHPFYTKLANRKYARKCIPKRRIEALNVLYNPESIALNMAVDPNVVKFYCAYETKENTYLIFDYIPYTLQKLFDGDSDGDLESLDILKSLTLDIQRNLDSVLDCKLWKNFEGIITGVNSLHTKNGSKVVIHRDLKPTNILIDKQGKFLICDFGLTTISDQATLDEYPQYYGTTQYQQQCGSYAPPRRFQGDKRNDDLVYDIWSLACIMLEILVFIIGFQTPEGLKTRSEALKAFRQARRQDPCTSPSFSNSRERFWFEPGPDPDSPKLSDTVEAVLNHMADYANQRNDKYLAGVLLILSQMFMMQASERPKSSEIVKKLAGLKGPADAIGETNITSIQSKILEAGFNQDDRYGIKTQEYLNLKPSDQFGVFFIPNIDEFLRNSRSSTRNIKPALAFPDPVNVLQIIFGEEKNDFRPNKKPKLQYLSLLVETNNRTQARQEVLHSQSAYRDEERVYLLHLYLKPFQNMFSFREICPQFRYHIKETKDWSKLIFCKLLGVQVLYDGHSKSHKNALGRESDCIENVSIFRGSRRKYPLDDALDNSKSFPADHTASISIHIWRPHTCDSLKAAQPTEDTRSSTSSRTSGNSGPSSRNDRLVIFRPYIPDYITIPLINFRCIECASGELELEPGVGDSAGNRYKHIICHRFRAQSTEEPLPSVPIDLDVLSYEEERLEGSDKIKAKSIVIYFKPLSSDMGDTKPAKPSSDGRSHFINMLQSTQRPKLKK